MVWGVSDSEKATNYAVTTVNGTWSIAKADATCSVSGYGGAYDAAEHGASGACSGIDGEPAGTLGLGASYRDIPGGIASWTFTGNGNYRARGGDVAITISPAELTVTADAKTKLVGEADPPLTYQAEGFKGSDNASTVLTGKLERIPGEDIGTYAINQGSLTANANYSIAYQSADLTISAPSPLAVFTGSEIYTVPSGTKATVPLSAVVKYPNGDVRNTWVTINAYLLDVDGNLVTPPAAECIDLPVGLVNPADLSTGTATCNKSLAVGMYGIVVTVQTSPTPATLASGYPSTIVNMEDYAAIIMVADSSGSLKILGGGKLEKMVGFLNNMGGQPTIFFEKEGYTHFGFEISYKKKLVNAIGRFHAVVHDARHVYRIVSKSITGVNITKEGGTAAFQAKALIYDITRHFGPILVDADASLAVTMNDLSGKKTDTIGITVLNKKGGIWFSTNWDKAQSKTVEQPVKLGELIVQ